MVGERGRFRDSFRRRWRFVLRCIGSGIRAVTIAIAVRRQRDDLLFPYGQRGSVRNLLPPHHPPHGRTFHRDRPTVQTLHPPSKPDDRFPEADLDLHRQIAPPPGVRAVPPFPYQEHHVRRRRVRHAVHHAAQSHGLPVRHAGSQRDLHLLPQREVRSERIGLLDRHVLRCAVVELLEGYLELVSQVSIARLLLLLLAGRPPSEWIVLRVGAEEFAKGVVTEKGTPSESTFPHGIRAGVHSHSTAVETLLAESIVHGPLPLAAQDVVRLADLVEGGTISARLVGMG
mmetsp:Transcript_23581/g.44825  ORF Transcript_23581/g.44825 Transcript_23581/m.44825 type:complete len:286 (-) Transcript_23581:372-1229(-)